MLPCRTKFVKLLISKNGYISVSEHCVPLGRAEDLRVSRESYLFVNSPEMRSNT